MPKHGEKREIEGRVRYYCDFCQTGGANGVNRRDIQGLWKSVMSSYVVHEDKLYYACHGCAKEAGPVAAWIRPQVNKARREIGSNKMRAMLLEGVALEDLKKETFFSDR